MKQTGNNYIALNQLPRPAKMAVELKSAFSNQPPVPVFICDGLATHLAEKLGADLELIKPAISYSGIDGYLRGIRRQPDGIQGAVRIECRSPDVSLAALGGASVKKRRRRS